MKITACFVAALALLAGGCAHPSMGGSQGDNLETLSAGSARTQDQTVAAQDYRQILADPGPF